MSERLRVAFLIGGLDPGGTERQLGLFLDRLNHDRFETLVIVLNIAQNRLAEAIRKRGVEVLFVPASCRSRWRRLLFLARMLRNRRVQVVHSWSFYANLYAGWAGRLAGVPRRLGSLRGSLDAPSARSLNPLLRWLSWVSVERLVVNSRALETELRQRGRGEHRLVYAPNLLFPERLEPGEPTVSDEQLESLGLRSCKRLIGAVGNLRRVKNHALLVTALGEVLPQFPNVGAVILGGEAEDEPEVAARLRQQIERLGLRGRVALAGFQANIPAWLRRMELFCHPSDHEGTSNAVLEAMALGLPIVATRVGEMPYLLEDGVAGVLVPAGDATALATALRSLLSNPQEARRKGAIAARKIAEEYTGERTVRVLESLYEGRA